MRRRINIQSATAADNGLLLTLSEAIGIEDIRLIVDETKKAVICSSMQKDNVEVTTTTSGSTILIPTKFGASASDTFTVEIDTTDKPADITDSVNKKVAAEHTTTRTAIADAKTAIKTDIAATQTAITNAHATTDTAIAATKTVCENGFSATESAISNAHTALLGEDTTATQTAILQAVATVVQDAAAFNKNLYSAHFEENTDNSDSYTMVLPMVAGIDEATQTVTI